MKKKHIVFTVVLLLLILTLAGCRSGLSSSGNPGITNNESFAVTDQKGRQINFAKVPDKIVSLSPANTEILFALGLGEKVVGVTQFCNYPEQAKTKTVIGTITDPNIEKIVSLQPGVVFSSTIAKEPVDKLEQAGIKVVVIDPQNIGEVLEAVKLIGKVTGTEQKGKELAETMNNELNAVQQKISTVPQDKKPLVYYEVWNDPLMTAGPNTFINYIITSAGGINLAQDAETDWPTYSAEKIIAKNPDYIVLAQGGDNMAGVEKRSGWNKIKAVQNKHILTVTPDIFNRPGPRIVDAVKILARDLYPDLF